MINEIQGLGNVNNTILNPKKQNNETGDTLFTDAIENAKKLVEANVAAEQKTTQLTYDFMTGKNENIHDLMIAQEKSGIILQFTMQVRNNLLEAYREIMRIPV